MADTQRTVSAILSLFADNITRNISEQDLRDFVVTALGVYGGLYANYAGDAIVTNANTYVTMTTVWTNTLPASGITCNASNGTLTLPVAGTYKVAFNLSGTCSNNNILLHAGVFANAAESVIEISRKIGTAGDYGAFGACGFVTVNANAVIDLRVKANSTTTFTPEHGQLICQLVG